MVACSTFPGCTEKISNKQGLTLREVTGSYKAKKKKKNKNGRFLGMALHFLWYPVRVDVQNIVKYSKSSDNIVSL